MPKNQGSPILIRAKYETSPTVYGLSAHITGPIQSTVHAKAEFESNFTDINFKVRNLI